MNQAKNTSYRRDQVVSVINSVISRMQNAKITPEETLIAELASLKNIIEDLRIQLNDTRAADIRKTHIPSAHDELDAVIGATEKATNVIMSACESISEISKGSDPGTIRGIEAETSRIYEACTFQDITGQRISKVIKTLKQIDGKVVSLLQALDFRPADAAEEAEAAPEGDGLLNGPALPHKAMSQDEIDRLLSSFDE